MIIIVILSAVSIFGYATFILHPQLLSYFSWAPSVFAMSFSFFSQALIILGFLVLAYECQKSLGLRWLRYFTAAYLISITMELASTTYGIPFGKYAYTTLLGSKILDHVPYLIPLSWFFMAVPSFCLAELILGSFKNRWLKVTLASLLLVTWDFTLDPVMSKLTPFWVWEEPGPTVLDVPIKNLAGWFLTGILICSAFELLKFKTPKKWIENSFPLKFYAANLLLPVGLAIAGQIWLALAATILVFLFCGCLAIGTGGVKNFRAQK